MYHRAQYRTADNSGTIRLRTRDHPRLTRVLGTIGTSICTYLETGCVINLHADNIMGCTRDNPRLNKLLHFFPSGHTHHKFEIG